MQNFVTMNYTELSEITNDHVYVEGTEIIIFFLILISFCSVINIGITLINAFKNRDEVI